MKFACTVKQLPRGEWYARSIGSLVGTIDTTAGSRDEALDKLRAEIRYRLELCPCSGVSNEYVELDIRESPRADPKASRGDSGHSFHAPRARRTATNWPM